MWDTTLRDAPACWIIVACAAHVRRGVAEGFCQVNHGKAAPLRRMTPGDRIAAYSPTETFGGPDRLQAFTALGVVADAPIEQVTLAEGFHPYRRAVRWSPARPAPIRPLLATAGFALSGANWGAPLRYGLVRIDAASMDMIAASMAV